MFRNQSISRKMGLVLWIGTVLLLLSGSAWFLFTQRLGMAERSRAVIEPYARLIAVAASSAVDFQNRERAQEVLNTLSADPQILRARVLLTSGAVLAHYPMTTKPPPAGWEPRADGVYVEGGTSELVQNLLRGNEVVGRLEILMDISELQSQRTGAIAGFAVAVAVLIAVAFIQMLVLRRTIIAPVSRLSAVAESIGRGGDYSLRAPLGNPDELGRLGWSFNLMVEAIQSREARLHQVTRLQQTIVNNAPTAIVSTTPEGIVTSFNAAAERLIGYSAAEVVGIKTPEIWHDPAEVRSRAAELSRETGQEFAPGFEVFVNRARRNLVNEAEWSFIRKDGRRFPVWLSVSALRDEANDITGFVGLASDLTERKKARRELEESQHLYEELVSSVPLGVYRIRVGAGDFPSFEYVSDRYCELTGLDRAALLADATLTLSIIHPEDQPGYQQANEAAVRSRGVFLWEGRVLPANRPRWLHIESRPTVAPGQDPVWTGVVQDITERKRQEEELQRKNDEMERFTYTVSHDLKSPLITIKGFAGALLKDFSAGRTQRMAEDLQRIIAASDKMADLLNALLQLSRIGRILNPPVDVDMNRLVADVLELLAGPLQESRTEVLVQPDLPAVHGDRQRLLEVYQNLLENALKFSPSQPTNRIEIGAVPRTALPVFYVRDFGKGIEAQYHETIFGLFNKLDARSEGVGIGLALVRRIIEFHGGQIWVESSGPGQGSTFYFTLPPAPKPN